MNLTVIGTPVTQGTPDDVTLSIYYPPAYSDTTGRAAIASYFGAYLLSAWKDKANTSNPLVIPGGAGLATAVPMVTIVETVRYSGVPRIRVIENVAVYDNSGTGAGTFDYTQPQTAVTYLNSLPLVKGDPGPTLKPRGAWSSATAYAVGDAVTYSGRVFAAIQASTNQTPPGSATSNAYWMYLPSQGDMSTGDWQGSALGTVKNSDKFGGQLPAYYAPANHDHSRLLMFGQSGGTIGKFVRKSGGANSWTNASNTDTADQLAMVAYQVDGTTIVTQGYVGGLSGLTPGQPVYLGTVGGYTQVAPTPGGGVSRVPIGQALTATEMVLEQGPVDSGGSGGAGVRVLGRLTAEVTNTGKNVQTALAAVTVPAGAMTATGGLRFQALYVRGGTTQTYGATLTLRLGGKTIATGSISGSSSGTLLISGTVQAMGATNSQRTLAQTFSSLAVSPTVGTTDTTADMSTAQDLVAYSQQNGNGAGETITLSFFVVELLP